MTTSEVSFVLPGAPEEELDRLRALDVDRDWRHFTDGVSAWIVQTYLLLREHGYPVALNSSFSREIVNVAHSATLAPLTRPRNCFVVGVRADYPPVRWCQFHIVQNQTQIGSSSFWIPHWSQPGLIPRDSGRGCRVERVGYFGRSVNHYTRVFRRASGYFRVRAAIERVCDHLGLELVHRDVDAWNDYSDIDLVIGLRSFGRQTYDTKPPTKLVNAWLAGVPFIGGNDSAFAQIGDPPINYLLAVSPDSMLHAIHRLIAQEEAYTALVNRGCEAIAAVGLSRKALVGKWIDQFDSILDGCM